MFFPGDFSVKNQHNKEHEYNSANQAKQEAGASFKKKKKGKSKTIVQPKKVKKDGIHACKICGSETLFMRTGMCFKCYKQNMEAIWDS